MLPGSDDPHSRPDLSDLRTEPRVGTPASAAGGDLPSHLSWGQQSGSSTEDASPEAAELAPGRCWLPGSTGDTGVNSVEKNRKDRFKWKLQPEEIANVFFPNAQLIC